MKIKTFENAEQIHKIWNDETWIRYNTIVNEMGMIDLTPEQEEALFPEVPDYFVIDNKAYKPEIAEHLEKYGRKIDGCSFFQIELQEVNDSDIIKKVNEQLRKEGRAELKEQTETWLDSLMKKHPWIEENRLRLRINYEEGQIDNACLTMNSIVITAIDKEHPKTNDVEYWLNQLTKQKEFIKWVVNECDWSVIDDGWLPNDITKIRIRKPITLNNSNTARVIIVVDCVNKTYNVTLTKPEDSDYIEAIVEFPVNDELIMSLRPSTQMKCNNGFIVSEHITVADTTTLGYILKLGVKEARTALSNQQNN